MDNLQILKLSENDIKCTDVAKFKKFLGEYIGSLARADAPVRLGGGW